MIRVVNPGKRKIKKSSFSMGAKEDDDDTGPEVPYEVALEHVRAARYYLIRPSIRPYLSMAAMSLIIVENPHLHIKTAAVDSSWRLYFDPKFVLKYEVPIVAAVVEHEIWHLLRRHAMRATNINLQYWAKDIWNIAADAEIHNDDVLRDTLINAGIEIMTAERIGCPPKLTAEQYYDDLIKRAIITDKGPDKGLEIRIPVPKKEKENE